MIYCSTVGVLYNVEITKLCTVVLYACCRILALALEVSWCVHGWSRVCAGCWLLADVQCRIHGKYIWPSTHIANERSKALFQSAYVGHHLLMTTGPHLLLVSGWVIKQMDYLKDISNTSGYHYFLSTYCLQMRFVDSAIKSQIIQHIHDYPRTVRRMQKIDQVVIENCRFLRWVPNGGGALIHTIPIMLDRCAWSKTVRGDQSCVRDVQCPPLIPFSSGWINSTIWTRPFRRTILCKRSAKTMRCHTLIFPLTHCLNWSRMMGDSPVRQ